MNTAIVGIPSTQLADCWNGIKHMVTDACTHSNGKYEAIDILHALLREHMQLWAIVGETGISAIVISEIVNYPRIREFRILATTGEGMSDWLHHLAALENWARSQGCQASEAIARPGWEKVLKSENYKRTHIILNKSLGSSETMQ